MNGSGYVPTRSERKRSLNKNSMAGLIIKEYQVYCKNYKDCHQWTILTANTPRADAIRSALSRGWKRDAEELWVCPKCLKKQEGKKLTVKKASSGDSWGSVGEVPDESLLMDHEMITGKP